ncbi:CKLF-like MARVEL transmembrane domain-containing protein 8-like, partial [Scleropages formosus]
MTERAAATAVSASVSTGAVSNPLPSPEHPACSTLVYDARFLRSAPAIFIFAELVFGLLVWMLITGTEYFHVPAFGWVMFVAVTYWVLTVFFLIMYLTNARARMPRVPWTTVALGFNVSGAVFYLVAIILEATSLHLANKKQHTFDSWTASM